MIRFKSAAAGAAPKPGAPSGDTSQARTPRGTLIGYATGPGQTASDGKKGDHRPYTKALLDNIARPGVEIQQAMRLVRAQLNDETNKSSNGLGSYSDLTGRDLSEARLQSLPTLQRNRQHIR